LRDIGPDGEGFIRVEVILPILSDDQLWVIEDDGRIVPPGRRLDGIVGHFGSEEIYSSNLTANPEDVHATAPKISSFSLSLWGQGVPRLSEKLQLAHKIVYPSFG
jgi:hypothetical protein